MTRSTALLLLLFVAAACTYGARRSFERTFQDLDRSFRVSHMAIVEPPEPPEPFTLRRRELYLGMRGKKEAKYLARAAELFSSRLDVLALPYGTTITVWSLGDDVIAAEIQRADDLGGPLLALPALTRDGLIRFYDESGKGLDGAFIARPLDYDYISSAFGPRIHPITGRAQRHRGVDYSAARGTPVVSVGDGVVVAAGEDAYAGIHVVVRHRGTGITTKYFHLDALAENVALNARVQKGQVIGVVGSTGISTGPHLHFEVLKNGARVDPSLMEWPAGAKLTKNALKEHRALGERLRAMTAEDEILAWQDVLQSTKSPAS